MFVVITGCLLAMAFFISKLPELVSFCLASLMTLAGSLEWLCRIYCCVPGTFLAEAFAKVKWVWSTGKQVKGKAQSEARLGSPLSLPGVLCDCYCTCPVFSPQHKWPGIHLQLGQMRTVFYTISVGALCHLHSWNEQHVLYFFIILLTFEGQISDPQNTWIGFNPKFWISRLFWEAL